MCHTYNQIYSAYHFIWRAILLSAIRTKIPCTRQISLEFVFKSEAMRKMHLKCLSGHHHDRQRGNGGSLGKQNPVPVMFIVRSLPAYRETGYLKAHRIDFKIGKINKPLSSPLLLRFKFVA